MSSVPRKTPLKSPAKKAHAFKAPHGGYHPMKGPAKASARKATFSYRPSGEPVRLPAIAGAKTHKIASCEISRLASEREHQKRAPTADAAWAKMMKVREFDDVFSNDIWTPKAVATLEACLDALSVWGIDGKLFDAIRLRLKKERGRRRALNKNNPFLVILHCCHEKLTLAQRKENSRFAKVVEVAYAQQIRGEQAEKWLRSNTQKAILEQHGKLKGKEASPPRTVMASKTVRPHIWKAIKAGKGKEFALAIKKLDALEEQLAACV